MPVKTLQKSVRLHLHGYCRPACAGFVLLPFSGGVWLQFVPSHPHLLYRKFLAAHAHFVCNAGMCPRHLPCSGSEGYGLAPYPAFEQTADFADLLTACACSVCVRLVPLPCCYCGRCNAGIFVLCFCVDEQKPATPCQSGSPRRISGRRPPQAALARLRPAQRYHHSLLPAPARVVLRLRLAAYLVPFSVCWKGVSC